MNLKLSYQKTSLVSWTHWILFLCVCFVLIFLRTSGWRIISCIVVLALSHSCTCSLSTFLNGAGLNHTVEQVLCIPSWLNWCVVCHTEMVSWVTDCRRTMQSESYLKPFAFHCVMWCWSTDSMMSFLFQDRREGVIQPVLLTSCKTFLLSNRWTIFMHAAVI